MGVESLVVNLSGGATNTTPAASTGGGPSTMSVLSQTATFISIPGITVVDAAGNAAGTGLLEYFSATKEARYTPPGGTVGPLTFIGSTGVYLVRGGGEFAGYLKLSVVFSLLPTVDYSRNVTITNNDALFLPPVDKATALAGATQYFLFYLTNTGAATITSAAIKLAQDTTGQDTLSIAIVPTKNTQEAQIDAPGHTYSAVGVSIPMGDLLAGDYWGFWVKRVVPTGLVDGVTANTFRIQVTSLT